jgi:AraC-like DNA-binding protein
VNDYELPEAFFRPHIPRGDLARFVQFIWIARGRVPHQRERVLPNGVIELIINLGEPHNVLEREDYSQRTVYRNCWLAGIQNRHIVIESLYGTDLIGIRFKPGGAYAFLGMPLAEVTDQVIEFDLIDRALGEALRGRVLQAKDDAARIECIERALRERLLGELAGHPAVQFVCDAIRATSGLVRIADLVERTGLSHRRLMDHFERNVGMAPKALAQVYKFQNVLKRIERDAAPDWSQVAAECGYYDQPHLNHEFRRLSGLTPTQYLATRLADFNHTVAD